LLGPDDILTGFPRAGAGLFPYPAGTDFPGAREKRP
jgi:hypothetical protein